MVSTLEADCPWQFGDKLPGPKRGADKHYGTLSIDDIMRFPLVPTAFDCRLFLWRVGAMQQEALDVGRAWGFTQKSELVWIKTTQNGKALLIDEDGEVSPSSANNLHFGMGHQTRYAHEVCLILTRGSPVRLAANVRSVFFAPVPRGPDNRPIHSRKPDKFYNIVERLSPGPYHSMFSRLHRPGWTCEGDELDTAQEEERPASDDSEVWAEVKAVTGWTEDHAAALRQEQLDLL